MPWWTFHSNQVCTRHDDGDDAEDEDNSETSLTATLNCHTEQPQRWRLIFRHLDSGGISGVTEYRMYCKDMLYSYVSGIMYQITPFMTSFYIVHCLDLQAYSKC